MVNPYGTELPKLTGEKEGDLSVLEAMVANVLAHPSKRTRREAIRQFQRVYTGSWKKFLAGYSFNENDLGWDDNGVLHIKGTMSPSGGLAIHPLYKVSLAVQFQRVVEKEGGPLVRAILTPRREAEDEHFIVCDAVRLLLAESERRVAHIKSGACLVQYTEDLEEIYTQDPKRPNIIFNLDEVTGEFEVTPYQTVRPFLRATDAIYQKFPFDVLRDLKEGIFVLRDPYHRGVGLDRLEHAEQVLKENYFKALEASIPKNAKKLITAK